MRKTTLTIIIICVVVISSAFIGVSFIDTEPRGDTDNDGYNDTLEEEIDILDPDKKDVVVRVKYGDKVDEKDLTPVVKKYEEAPISNPDGTEGINLILVEEDEYIGVKDYYTLQIVEDVGINGYAGYTIEGNDKMMIEARNTDNYTEFNFMHELGHQLGLNEDLSGVDSFNYTYNEYPSVMNYNTDKNNLGYDNGVMRNEWEIINENLNSSE